MKKLMAIVFFVSAVAVLFMMAMPTVAANEMKVTINGQAVVFPDAKPFIDANSRTLVPLRPIAEAMKLDVEWNGVAREAKFSSAISSVVFKIGSNVARQDEKNIVMDTEAVIVDGRTYAPVRYLAEAMGYTVGWDAASQTVTLIKGDVSVPPAVKSTVNLTLGEVDGSRYNNDYFGLTFTFPNDWENIAPRETVEMLTKSFNNVNLSEDINLSKQSHLVLFSAMTSGKRTVSIIEVSAVKIGSVTDIFGEITTVAEFMKENARFEDALGVVELNDIKSVTLGSKEFLYRELSLPLNVEQAYMYACEENGYILVFTARTAYDEATDDITRFIRSINFN